MRRTKIVASVGPATASPSMLEALIDAGMDVARLALAHGKIEEHIGRIAVLRKAAKAQGRTVGVMADLPGPKVRVNTIEEGITLLDGSKIEIAAGTEQSSATCLVSEYDNLLSDVAVGDVIGLGDGSVTLMLTEVEEIATAVVVHGGHLIGRPGLKFPAGRLSMPVPTKQDEELLVHCLAADVDLVAVSFVRSAQDVLRVRDLIGNDGPLIVSKIETKTAIENLEEIVAASDAVMVARGDLGTECDLEDVPHLQKRIIKSCIMNGRPVITATQMLESMLQSPIPTRAEVSDVANAVLDGTDAVMLSGETAIGQNPIEVVRTMARIVCKAEESVDTSEWEMAVSSDGRSDRLTEAITHAAWQAASDSGATAILCCTRSGATSRAMASLRPVPTLLGVTPNEKTLRQQTLTWGVVPLRLAESSTTEEVVQNAIVAARAAGFVASKDVVVVLAGSPDAGVGNTDVLRLVRVE